MTEKNFFWLTIVSNTAVFVGLLFLIIEIQQNSAIARTSEYRENVENIADYKYLIGSDPKLFELQGKLLQGDVDELSVEDLSRIIYVHSTIFGLYENAFYAWRNGIISDLQWSRFEAGACPNYQARKNVPPSKTYTSLFVTPDFQEYLNGVCN